MDKELVFLRIYVAFPLEKRGRTPKSRRGIAVIEEEEADEEEGGRDKGEKLLLFVVSPSILFLPSKKGMKRYSRERPPT